MHFSNLYNLTQQRPRSTTAPPYPPHPPPIPLPIHLAKHQIHRPNNRHRIRQQMPAGNLVEAAKMGEARRTNLAPVRPLAAIAHQKHAHLALGRFNSRVRLARGDRIALRKEQKVVNKGLHIFLHRGARRGRDLVVLDADGARGHLIEALVDDAEGLAELLHAAEVAVVAVAVDADGHVELDLVVRVVRLAFADVPRHAAAAQHHARVGVVERVGGGHHPDALRAPFPDPVVCQQFFRLVDPVPELRRPLVDVVQEAERQVLVHAAGADVGGVQAGARDALVEFLGGGEIGGLNGWVGGLPLTSLAPRNPTGKA